MDVMHVIVKIYVTERNEVIQRHSTVTTIWPANERSKMAGVQEKESIMGVSGR